MADGECHLLRIRKNNSKHPHPGWLGYLIAYYCKRVETAASQIERLLPKHIHAVIAACFELKTVLLVLAATIFAFDLP